MDIVQQKTLELMEEFVEVNCNTLSERLVEFCKLLENELYEKISNHDWMHIHKDYLFSLFMEAIFRKHYETFIYSLCIESINVRKSRDKRKFNKIKKDIEIDILVNALKLIENNVKEKMEYKFRLSAVNC
jgi:hypothetical protein